jgi:HEAT repeat protein
MRLPGPMRGGLLAASVLAAGCAGSGSRDLSSLTSPEAATRARAVVKLGRSASPEDLPLLLARVGDPDPTVRANVAVALGRYDTLQSVEALSDLSGDVTEAVQLAAVRSLGGLTLAQAQAQLLRDYQQGTSSVRAEVASVLRGTHRSPQLALEAEARELWQRLSEELERGKLEERVGAAEELGRSGKPQAVERLTQYLGADPPRLAAAAILGLGATRSGEARAPLEAILSSDNPELQATAAQALGSLGVADAASALARLASRGGALGRIALDGIEALGPSRVVAALCQAALGEDPEVVSRAARLVAEARAECDLKPFLTKLGRERGSAASALAALAEFPHEVLAAEARRIHGLLASGPRDVRALAARAAGTLGLDSLAPEVLTAFESAQADLEATRLRWITEPLPSPDGGVSGSGARAGPERDRFFARDPPDLVALKAEAGGAALRLGVGESAQVSKELSNDLSPEVRLAAVGGLRYLRGPERIGELGPLLADPDLRVRVRALEVLPAVLEGATAPQIAATAENLLTGWRRQARDPPSDEARLRIDRLGKLGALCAHGANAGAAATSPSCGADIQKALEEALRIGETAGAAASALRGLPSESAGEVLLARLRERPSAGLPELVAAAAEREASASAPLLRPLLFHARPGVRAAAARALKSAGSPEVLEDVQSLRADYFVAVREAVAESDRERKGP